MIRQIKVKLYRQLKIDYPKSKDKTICKHINSVVNSSENREIINYLIAKSDLENCFQFLHEITRYSLIEQNMKNKQDEPEVKVDEDGAKKEMFTIKSQYGRTIKAELNEIKGEDSNYYLDDETIYLSIEKLLSNPLIIEKLYPDKALYLIDKYYDIPLLEKEAYKLRLLESINRTVVENDLRKLFNDTGILRLQRRAAIRIKVLWEKEIKDKIRIPISKIIEDRLAYFDS